MTSNVDISALGNLQPSEPLDLADYADERPVFELPKAGEYTLRAPDSFPAESFGASRAGFLTARIDPTIVGPTNEGFTVRYANVSAKPYTTKAGATLSQAGLYLKACGTQKVSGEPQEIANAIADTAGRTYRAYLDWEARHYATGFEVKGMTKFPSDGNGGHQSWVLHPTEKDAEGNPLKLRANLVIRRFLAA